MDPRHRMVLRAPPATVILTPEQETFRPALPGVTPVSVRSALTLTSCQHGHCTESHSQVSSQAHGPANGRTFWVSCRARILHLCTRHRKPRPLASQGDGEGQRRVPPLNQRCPAGLTDCVGMNSHSSGQPGLQVTRAISDSPHSAQAQATYRRATVTPRSPAGAFPPRGPFRIPGVSSGLLLCKAPLCREICPPKLFLTPSCLREPSVPP